MKTRGKKALALLLSLLMVISLFGGITIVSAEEGPAVNYYQAVDDFTVGQPTLIVAEYEGSYYALTYSDGAIGAVEVTVDDSLASGSLDDSALWTCSETGLLESVGSPGLSLRGGSSFKVNNQGDRPGYYDAENKTYYVWNYNGTYYYPLTCDGTTFTLGNDSGSSIQLYEPYLFKAAEDLAADVPSILVAEVGEEHYALAYDGSAIYAAPVSFNADGDISGVAPDGQMVWFASDTGLLQSAAFPGLSLRGGSSFKVNNQGDRPGYYDAENKIYYVWNYNGTYYYPLTCDGTTFTLGNDSGSAITIYSVPSLTVKYTITFEPNMEGLDAMTGTKAEGEDYEITESLSKIGWIFQGWNTKADGSGILYQVGDFILADEDLTLYAIWEENTDLPLTYFARNDELTADGDYVIVAQAGDEYYALVFDGTNTDALKVTVDGDYATLAAENPQIAVWTLDDGNHFEAATAPGTYVYPYSGGMTYSSGRVFEYDAQEDILHFATSSSNGWVSFSGGKFGYIQSDTAPAGAAKVLLFSPADVGSLANTLEEGASYYIVGKSGDSYYAMNGSGSAAAASVSPEGGFMAALGESARWTYAGGSLTCGSSVRSNVSYADGALKIGTSYLTFSGGSFTTTDAAAEILLFKFVPAAEKYTLTFDGNAPDVATTTAIKTEGKNYTITESPARRSYTLTGWNTKADGTGTSYAVGGVLTDEAIGADGTLTLYAIWAEAANTEAYVFEKAEYTDKAGIGAPALFVAKAGENCFALSTDGSTVFAETVNVASDGTITLAGDTAVWYVAQNGYLKEKLGSERYGGYYLSFAGGLGVDTEPGIVWYENGVLALKSDTDTVVGYLAFDGGAFSVTANAAEACALDFYVQAPIFSQVSDLTAGKDYVIATAVGEEYYALSYDGDLGAIPVTYSEGTVAASSAAAWHYADDQVLESAAVPGNAIFGSSGGFMVYDSTGSYRRTFVYDGSTQKVSLHNGAYYMTFDAEGKTFGQASSADGAATVLVFERPALAGGRSYIPDGSDIAPVERSAVTNADGSVTLSFTSDVHHDGSDNLNLQAWLEASGVGYIDAFGFCGDMGSAYASVDDYWPWTEMVMDYVSGEIAAGKIGDAVYTFGNHEWFPSAGGNYAVKYEETSAQQLLRIGEGVKTDKYVIYCFGSGKGAMDHVYDYDPDDIERLEKYLSTAPTGIPIFILTHYPLHYWTDVRSVEHAPEVISVLNAAVDAGHEIIVLWGHNHSDFDDYYYIPSFPGETMVYAATKDAKTGEITPKENGTAEIKFTYVAAGCTSDAEYTGADGGSAATMNKGLIVTIGADGKLDYTYYTMDGERMPVQEPWNEPEPWLVRYREGVEPEDGSALPVINTQYVADGGTARPVSGPLVKGYVFDGWTSIVNGSDADFDITTPITKNTLITAKYSEVGIEIEEATLTPDETYNGEKITMTAVGLQGQFTLFDIGSIFGGGSGPFTYALWFDEGSSFSFDKPVSFTKQYFDSEYNVLGTDTVELAAGQVVNVADGVDSTYEGKNIAWSEFAMTLDPIDEDTQANSILIVYAPDPGNYKNAEPDTPISKFPGNVTGLPDEFTVTFDPNRDDITEEYSDTKFDGYDYKITLNLYADTGTHLGWNTAADGTGTAYNVGDYYTANEEITLYAQWDLKTYTITFVSGVDGIGNQTATKTQSMPYVVKEHLSMQREGFSFEGWNTMPDGSGKTYAVGDTITDDADLTLYAVWEQLVTITKQPVSVTAAPGDFASFRVEAVGQNLRYQWQYWTGDDWANTGDDWNSDTDTMSFQAWDGGNGLCFRCVVWNDEDGTDWAVSDTVSLTVGAPKPVTITKQPVSVTAAPGEYVKYRVDAEGQNLRYQWQYWAGEYWANTGDDWNSGTDTMSFWTWPEGDGLCFRCVIWNELDGTDWAATDTVSLTVTAPTPVNPVTITLQPESVTTDPGKYVEYHVEATGENLRYQWQYWAGEYWVNTGDDWNSGTDTMSFWTWPEGNGLCFRCVIWNELDGTDWAATETVSLTVNAANPVTITLQPESVVTHAGAFVEYHVEATGENLCYQWQYWAGDNWANTGDDWNSSTDTMSFWTWPEGDGLSFRCVVWNELDGTDWTFSDTVSLTVD